ncbi:MAG: tetratricopeptide repeat protein [Balneolaceae bacterium]|nr:tetratricopeptide repeat protein [Balneolaceae bacterium]
MKTLSDTFIIVFLILIGIACSSETDDGLKEVPEGAQAVSLLGEPLYKPDLPDEVFDAYSENLEEALTGYRTDPENAESIIWLGRRTAYLGEYREAVRIFTEGVFKHPEDPRMYRHRGHRYITLRQFDEAIEDLERAAELMRSQPDAIEPDGLPNALNQPVSTLKSNVWYHLGLAHYLKGDYQNAIDVYENAFQLDLTEDMRIAMLYWYYSSLKRMGMDEEAGQAVAEISPDIELIENDVYLNLILVFDGIFDADRMMETAEDAIQNATLAYGLGNWHYMNGREERAFEIWREILELPQWAAFGYIAAEAELARAGEASIE